MDMEAKIRGLGTPPPEEIRPRQDVVLIPVPLELREPLQRILRSEKLPTVLTVTRTGEATFVHVERRTSTVTGKVSEEAVAAVKTARDANPPPVIDRDALTPLQRSPAHVPAHPAPLYGQDFLEPIARKLYETRMAGYTPNAGVAAPMLAPMPWEQLTEGTRELWRNVASVAVLHIAERTPPTLDLAPAEVEALDAGVKAALTIGMLDPRRSATDKDTTAKVLHYIADQRERFTAAAVDGQQLTFAPAPIGPVTMISMDLAQVPIEARLLPHCTEMTPTGRCVRRVGHSGTGLRLRLDGDAQACTPDFEHARYLDARAATPSQCMVTICDSGQGGGGNEARCVRRAGHSNAGQAEDGCTRDPQRARELDARDFKAVR